MSDPLQNWGKKGDPRHCGGMYLGTIVWNSALVLLDSCCSLVSSSTSLHSSPPRLQTGKLEPRCVCTLETKRLIACSTWKEKGTLGTVFTSTWKLSLGILLWCCWATTAPLFPAPTSSAIQSQSPTDRRIRTEVCVLIRNKTSDRLQHLGRKGDLTHWYHCYPHLGDNYFWILGRPPLPCFQLHLSSSPFSIDWLLLLLLLQFPFSSSFSYGILGHDHSPRLRSLPGTQRHNSPRQS